MPSIVPPSHTAVTPTVQGLRNGRRQPPVAADARDAPGRVRFGDIPPGERLLRLRDVLAIVGLSRAHVYNLIKQQLFPRPIALGSNCARWVQSEVQAWVGDSIATARLTPSLRRSGRTYQRQ